MNKATEERSYRESSALTAAGVAFVVGASAASLIWDVNMTREGERQALAAEQRLSQQEQALQQECEARVTTTRSDAVREGRYLEKQAQRAREAAAAEEARRHEEEVELAGCDRGPTPQVQVANHRMYEGSIADPLWQRFPRGALGDANAQGSVAGGTVLTLRLRGGKTVAAMRLRLRFDTGLGDQVSHAYREVNSEMRPNRNYIFYTDTVYNDSVTEVEAIPVEVRFADGTRWCSREEVVLRRRREQVHGPSSGGLRPFLNRSRYSR